MADMSANSDGAVDALATYVRASFAMSLVRIHETGSATSAARAAYAAGADDATLDALVPALRTAHSTNSTSSISTPLLPDTAAWKRVLLAVFRRFAGRMVVRGKLLNQGELLISHFCRVDAAVNGRPRDFCVRIPESLLSSLRVILPCEDGSAEQVGRDDVIARVKPASYPASADAEVVVSVCSASDDHLEHNANSPVITPSMWENAHALTDLDTLYGFDVRFLLQSHNGIVACMADENEDSANAVIARAPAFSDLQYTQLMMRNYGILQSGNSNSSSSVGRFKSFATETSGASEAMEEHPRSYISLGKAQKKRWADERLASGQELAAKRRMKDALAEFSSCLTLEEEHVGAFFARAEAFASLQHFPDAIRDLEMVKRLDPAFPGLDEALARARSKLKHSRHAEIPSSLVDLRDTSIAAPGSHSFKSQLRLKAHSDGYSKNATTKCREEKASNTKNPSQDDDSRLVRRSQSSSSSLSKPRAAAAASDQHQSKKKELERDRLRRLLEEEVEGKRDRKEKRPRRKKSRRTRYSSDDGEDDSSDDSSDDGSIRKKRKSSSVSKKKKKKKRKHAEKREQSSRKSTNKKHRRRHRSNDDSSSDSSSDSDSPSGSDRSRKRNRKQKKKHSRHSSGRDRSASRGRGGENSNDASTKEAEPHPILARQRHRIWN